MKINKWIIVFLFLLLCFLLFFILRNKPKNIESQSSPTLNTTSNSSISDSKEQTFLIDGFPIDSVPLYKLNKISSSKIFVNTDPKNKSEFDETNFSYFNVVFFSDASKEEFLNYYKNLFESEIKDEYENENMVKGKIGQYKVSAAHYGSDNTGYIQVHLPNYKDESIDKYFIDFPKILDLDSSLVEHDKSYGLLNQSGGQVEFTKYFAVIDSGDQNNDGKDDVDEFLILENGYKEQFKDKQDYSYDEKNGVAKWVDGDFAVTLSISRDHGRIYLMLRKSI